MLDTQELNPPPTLEAIEEATEAVCFTMGSEPRTGSLLRTLAASKPGGRLLELGSGTGMGTAWILDGMDEDARLITVDNDAERVTIAQRHLGDDGRVSFRVGDGQALIARWTEQGACFDFIFADTWPGKYFLLDTTLSLLSHGGFYVLDDLLMQMDWPEEHAPKVFKLLQALEGRDDLRLTRLNWSTGLLVAVKSEARLSSGQSFGKI